ncbi:hypothetical protein C8A03DRAFT_38142 [Achaetomium macrosporum]|uniref:Uncharacterized protein n=1 Tax=Achaetomium macrosporum TaxID=79813 RepID=A0AAN7C2N5_9PEZI|nr:hypothetical protein C8A03DRAFT_38142 [Achaetomium macrosporum]
MSALQRQLAMSRALQREHAMREELELAKEKRLAEMWRQARIAMENGTWEPPRAPRVPVIIRSDGTVSSAEKLQQLAELESVPETIDAVLIKENGRETNKPVTICLVDWDVQERIHEKAVAADGMAEHNIVLLQEQERYAMVVTALKEGVKLGNEAG